MTGTNGIEMRDRMRDRMTVYPSHLATPKARQVNQNTILCHSSRFLATETGLGDD
jgi:hypothetical protein